MPVLDPIESMKLIKPCGIKFAKHRFVTDNAALERACEEVEFPLVMKVVSSAISHKTDAGGVELDVKSKADASRAFSRMAGIKGFKGVIVQEFIRGKQIIIGGKKDVQFGPTALFGLGGIFVEVFRDFSVGVCPLKKRDARRMVRGIKAYPLLTGIRGQKAVDIPAIEEALLNISNFMCRNDQVKELDLNPLIANEKGVVAVDARIVV